ncbi:hypothetical protein CDEF62S_01992 [Castellaniella defragrans]
MAVATAGMVAGSYQRCGLAPGRVLMSVLATTTWRCGAGAEASSLSIQGS